MLRDMLAKEYGVLCFECDGTYKNAIREKGAL
jgi:hypothetical protein